MHYSRRQNEDEHSRELLAAVEAEDMAHLEGRQRKEAWCLGTLWNVWKLHGHGDAERVAVTDLGLEDQTLMSTLSSDAG